MINDNDFPQGKNVELTVELEVIAIKMNSNPNLTYLEAQAEYNFENREIILFE